MADQLQIDYQLRAVLADVQDLVAGVEYTLYGKKYKYMGTDLIHKQAMVLQRDHPEMFNPQIALAMMRDPLGYKPPPFQLSPAVVAGVAAAAAAGKLADLAGMGDAVSKLAPGLSAAVEGLKGTISGITDKLPIKALGAGGIAVPGQIAKVKESLNAALKGPTSAISMAMKGSLLADVAKAADAAKTALGAVGGAVSLANQAAGMAKAMSSGNPVAIAAVASGIASKFPMINPNAIASQMVSGALSGAGFDIASKLPNLSLSPDGIMKMMPIPGKVPTKDAKPPIKTAAPPKPVKPVELKNLFAEGAAAGSISDLTKPLSQVMGIAATVASAVGAVSMLASSPAATSAGLQKMTGNANTVNWGSNGYTRDPYVDAITARRMALSSSIEKHTKELNVMVAEPYDILYSLPYSELVRRYPQIRPNTPVAQALQFIKTAQTAALLAGITVDIVSSIGGSANFESGGIIDSGAAISESSTTPNVIPEPPRRPDIPVPPTKPDDIKMATMPNPQAPYDSSSTAYTGLDGEFGTESNYASINKTIDRGSDPYQLGDGFNDPQEWVKTVEDKITEEVVSGPNLPDPNQGYDYGQQGDNSVGENYSDYSE